MAEHHLSKDFYLTFNQGSWNSCVTEMTIAKALNLPVALACLGLAVLPAFSIHCNEKLLYR